MLVALLFYGYATGVFSSRKIERACLEYIAFRYIDANTRPDHDTIADLLKRVLPVLPALPSIFLQVLLIAKELGFLSVGQISLDGSKIKANASKHHAYSNKHAGKVKAKLRREVTRLLKLAEKAHTTSPWKGSASFYFIIVEGPENAGASRFYSAPKPAAEEIDDRAAFWRGVVVEP